MKVLSLFAALAIAAAANAQTTTGGFAEGDWNPGQFEQRTLGRIALFPNPANDQVSISFPGLTGEAVVTIAASDGRIVEKEQMNETTGTQLVADLSGLPSGAYVVNVEQEGDRVTERLMVAH